MKKRAFWSIAAILVAVTVWNWPMSYRIGINGMLHVKKIPLYAKACGFLYRDWMYKDLVREIAGKKEGDLDKVLALMGWVHANIALGVPAGLKTVDDHPLNIIIRQYGTEDQIEDVFTILCSYAGIKAGYDKCYNQDRSREAIFSFVYIGGRWIVFDASRNRYFVNGQGRPASVDDCVRGDVALSDEESAAYKQYFSGMKELSGMYSTRPEEQMPLRRAGIEIMKAFRGDRK